MTKEYPCIAIIQSTAYFNGEPYHDYECTWVGSKYAVVYVSKYLYDMVGLSVYPWPLKILEDDIDFGRSMAVVRKDVGWHFWWMLVSMWYKLFRSRGYRHFKWRVVKTFEIWGLAYQPEAEITSWKNIGRKRDKRKMG